MLTDSHGYAQTYLGEDAKEDSAPSSVEKKSQCCAEQQYINIYARTACS
jgi:hypothetical protein